MSDRNLTVEAKAIYRTLPHASGRGDERLPSVAEICEDLNMCEGPIPEAQETIG